MKARMLALAGVALIALAGPAAASDAQGWYLDIGAGWDHMGNLEAPQSPFLQVGPTKPTPLVKYNTGNSALVTGSIGFRFPARIRTEVEIGWTNHDVDSTVYTKGDEAQIVSLLYNVAYDLPITDRWDFTLGAGLGIGDGAINIPLVNDEGHLASGVNQGFMWQAMAGFNYSLTDNIDLTFDWRYRSLSVNRYYTSDVSLIPNNPLGRFGEQIRDLNEQAFMFGIRYYLWSAPPPPPPPTKTFIVFFDFNKSNLTAEAQAVVQEAVKVAKENGFVRVLVTGHTDTVGSDSYNQALSVRRAQSVKDEMEHEGMDGSQISIEGKSFHDPLVPTGPGVREPQNRRAVIDLGGGS